LGTLIFMGTTFDFDEEFGIPKKLLCKNFNKVQISVHPYFSGIYLCYQEAFKSLKTDLSTLNFQWFIYWSQHIPKSINLLVHSFPQNEEKVELLKKEASLEFMKFLSSYHHDLDRMNPAKMQSLINAHISSEVILALNKENSFKPHRTMSLDLHRNKVINRKRQNVLDQLQQTSGIVQQLLNNVDFVLTPDQLWKT